MEDEDNYLNLSLDDRLTHKVIMRFEEGLSLRLIQLRSHGKPGSVPMKS